MARLARPVIGVAAATVATLGIAAVALFAIPTEPAATYRATSDVAQVVGITAGVALIVAALATLALTGRAPLALLLLAAAALWFAQDLEALGDSASLARTIATGVLPLLSVLPLQLAFAMPGRRLSHGQRRVIAVAYVAVALTSIALVVLRDPFRDVYCWRQCGDNPLLVHAAPGLAHALVICGLVVSVVAGVIAAGVVAWRVGSADRLGRDLLAPGLIPVALVAAAGTAHAVALLATPLEDPHRAGFMATYLFAGGALAALALGSTWTAARAFRTRLRVTRLAAELGTAPAPGKLREVLATALGDPTVDVVYWVPALGAFAGPDGALRPHPTRPVTRITRGPRLLALVVHDTPVLGPGELERLLAPSARLAIENEALRAEVLAQLAQLQRSRARIVATADETRRRLERDLHDDAQQRLLSVVLDLRLAGTGADGQLGDELGRLVGEVEIAFNELRDLAHGIYPAVLTEAGLEAALPTLAAVAPIAVKMDDVTDRRLPPPVEASAYVTIDEAIHDAAARRATAISVSAKLHDGRLVVTADDDGAPRENAMVHVADRVGALGGALELSERSLRAEMPCA